MEFAQGRFCPSTARLRGSGAVAFWAFFCCLSKFLGAYLSNNFFSCNYNSLEAQITADRAQQQQPLATFFNLLVWCRFPCRSRVTAHVKAARVAICCRRASLHTMPRPTGPPPLCALAAAPEARARWPLWSAPRAHCLSWPAHQCVEGRLPRAGAARDVMFSSKKCPIFSLKCWWKRFEKMLDPVFPLNKCWCTSFQNMLTQLFMKNVGSTLCLKNVGTFCY
jgi:hypothetical protein